MKRKTPVSRQQIYRDLLTLLYEGTMGHIGSCLSVLDVMYFLFSRILTKDDVFLLSKGHAAPALYILQHHFGNLSKEELNTFHHDGTTLPVHPPYGKYDTIPFPTGSLGHGLSLCTGIAHGFKLKSKKKPRVYCVMSDGECNEGQVWEAAQYASFHALDNLVLIIDKNRFQALGKTKEVLGDAASTKKWQAFGFETFSCNGHDMDDIAQTFERVANSTSTKPKVIIAKTIKGFPISYMMDTVDWHYLPMTDVLFAKAMRQIMKKL